MREKYIELAKKIKALADRGIDGEKLSAQKLLDSLIKKHNLTIEDIEGEQTTDFSFIIEASDRRLFIQVVYSVNYAIPIYGPMPEKKIREFQLAGNYLITCTAAEYIEIESKYQLFYRLYKKEEDIFFAAFCIKNDLLIDRLGDDGEPSPEEMVRYLRANQMASIIRKETVRKQLNDKKP